MRRAAEGGGVIFPKTFAGRSWGLPPAIGGENIVSLVAIEVAEAEAVGVLGGAGGGFFGDRGDFPKGGGVFVGAGDALVAGCGVGIFGVAIGRAQQFGLAVAIDIDDCGAFVVGDFEERVLLPRPFFALGIFKPPGRRAGEIDHNHIGPAIAIEIAREGTEGVAVIVGIVFGRLFGDRVHFPIWRGVPDVAGYDVQLAIFVDVADGDAFGAEFAVEDRFFEGDFLREGGNCGRQGDECGSEEGF